MLYHIVLFQFKADTSADQIRAVIDRFLALKTECLRAASQDGYIVSSTGGKDISIENLQHGITHAFIVEFENEQDRDYYVLQDPAHQDFVKFAGPYLAKAQVLDFTKGSFTDERTANR